MLKQLSIENFTLISKAEIAFGPGFTAITGETGAGKSVLLKALRAVCGDKTPATAVRTGAEKAVIEAEFEVKGNAEVAKILDEIGIDFEDELVLRREISQTGKGRARINGALATMQDLQTLGERLVQMHGQSEQLMLRDTRTHAQMLDAYCGTEGALASYRASYDEWTSCKRRIEEAKLRAEKLAAEKDFLKFQFDELKEAALKEGEEEALEERTALAAKGETERRLLGEISSELEGEAGLLDKMGLLEAKVRQLAAKVPGYETWHGQLSEAQEPYESVLRELARLTPHTEMSEAELNRANARLAKIQRLKRKYKTDVPGLLALCERRRSELESLENLDSDLAEFAKQERAAFKTATTKASALSEARRESAARLDREVEEHLHLLGMPSAKFKTSIEPSELSPNGADKIEFLLAPNQGEGERSLQKAVSGGELSRVLLAFKTATANSDKVPLLIFDEVDSGISGEVGNKIGEALKELGRTHQVLTITHLHQVASRAARQIAVMKEELEGRTYTRVSTLEREARIPELVRMLGEADSPSAREHAREILETGNA